MKKELLLRMFIVVVLFTVIIFMVSCAKKQSLRTLETGDTQVDKQSMVISDEKKVKQDGIEVIKRPESAVQTSLNTREEKSMPAGSFKLENIYFEFDRADLTPSAKVILMEMAEWMKNNPVYSVYVEGHCDDRGTSEYNLALGEKRAYTAKEFLGSLGVQEARISTISYAEEKPAVQGRTESAWSKNRRDEFKLK